MKQVRQMEPWIDKEEEKEVLSVMRSGWITEAGETRKFEQAIVEFTRAKYCSVVANGTVSLFAALYALGVQPQDEVIVPDMTMVASPNAVRLAGAIPVFVDVKKDDLCLDLDDVERKITRRTKVIMPVAFNGRSPEMKRLLAIARKRKIFVLEDAAQALGSYYHGRHLGTLGEVGSFSFSTPKIITTGQGGALVTNNKKIYENIVRVKDFGRIDRNSQNHDTIGFNFKFTDLQAAIGVVQMKKLPWRMKRKKQMYALYTKLLQNIPNITFLHTNLEETAPWFIDIFVDNPNALQEYLKTYGIGSRLFYPAIHTTKPYKEHGVYPNALWASRHGLWLPSSTFLTDSDIIDVCQKITAFYEKNR